MTQVYEDVCLLCASLWMGPGTWRSNSHESFSSANFPDSYDSANCGQAKGKSTAISAAVAAGQWGAIRLEGDEDWSVGGARMRSLGMGIEGKAPKGKRRLSLSMTRAIVDERDKDKFGKRHSGTLVDVVADRSRENSDETAVDGLEQTTASAAIEANRQNTQTTLALLQTFHANTVFILSRLHELLPHFRHHRLSFRRQFLIRHTHKNGRVPSNYHRYSPARAPTIQLIMIMTLKQ